MLDAGLARQCSKKGLTLKASNISYNIRCPQCEKLLCVGRILLGAVEIKCKGCGSIVKVNQYGCYLK